MKCMRTGAMQEGGGREGSERMEIAKKQKKAVEKPLLNTCAKR